VAAEVALEDLASLVRSNTAPQASSSRTGRASLACSSAMRQLLTYWPRAWCGEWTFQLSRSSRCPSRRPFPPRHDGVGLAEQRLWQTSPTETPRRRRLDGGPQARAPPLRSPDVVLMGGILAME